MLRVAGSRRPAGRATVFDGPALVRSGCAVLNERFAVASGAAAVEFGVELFEHARGDLRNRLGAERGVEVEASVHVVGLASAVLDLDHAQPVAQGDLKGALRPRVTVLIDLREQAGTEPLGFLLVRGRLGEVHPFAGQRVDAGVDPDAQGTASTLDFAALARLTTRPFGHAMISPAPAIAPSDQN